MHAGTLGLMPTPLCVNTATTATHHCHGNRCQLRNSAMLPPPGYSQAVRAPSHSHRGLPFGGRVWVLVLVVGGGGASLGLLHVSHLHLGGPGLQGWRAGQRALLGRHAGSYRRALAMNLLL